MLILLTMISIASLIDPVEVMPEEKVTVQEIRINGNYETRESVILQLIEIHKGQVLNQGELNELIGKSRQNLIESQYFNSTSVFDLPRKEKNQAVVLIDVEEGSPWHYGASTTSIFLGRDNIGGLGYYASLDLGLDKQQVNATFNWLFQSKLFAYGEAGHINNRRLIIEDTGNQSFNYEAITTEGGVGWRFTPRITGQMGLRSEFVDNSGFRLSPDVASLYGVRDDSRLVVGKVAFLTDMRDRQFDTHLGNYVQLSAENTIDSWGSGYSHSKGQFDIRTYFSIADPTVVAGRIRWGNATPNLPYFKYFSTTGIDGVRSTGYQTNVGNRLMLANIEIRNHVLDLGIMGTWIELTPFADWGRCWKPQQFITPPFNWAVGGALRLRVPYPYAYTLRVEAGWSKNGFSTYWALDNPF